MFQGNMSTASSAMKNKPNKVAAYAGSKQGWLLQAISCLAYSSNLKMKVTYSSLTSAEFQQTTQHYIPKDTTLQSLEKSEILEPTMKRKPLWTLHIRQLQIIIIDKT
jgi:hypothetical protein